MENGYESTLENLLVVGKMAPADSERHKGTQQCLFLTCSSSDVLVAVDSTEAVRIADGIAHIAISCEYENAVLSYLL